VQNIPLPRRDLHFHPDKTVSLPSYLIPIALGIILVLGVIFTLPKIFRSFPSSSASTASSSVPAPVKATPVPAKPPVTSPQTTPPTQNSTKPPVETKSAPPAIPPTKPVETAAIRPASSTAAPLVAKSSSAKPERGDVLDKVLPEASHKALSTINGTVRVLVRVHVDPVGNVTAAEFDSPGPSKYFADLSLRAAQRWQFVSPVSEGHSLPSQWLIRFEFTRSGVTAIPAQQ
jgi:TonB family protein